MKHYERAKLMARWLELEKAREIVATQRGSCWPEGSRGTDPVCLNIAELQDQITAQLNVHGSTKYYLMYTHDNDFVYMQECSGYEEQSALWEAWHEKAGRPISGGLEVGHTLPAPNSEPFNYLHCASMEPTPP